MTLDGRPGVHSIPYTYREEQKQHTEATENNEFYVIIILYIYIYMYI